MRALFFMLLGMGFGLEAIAQVTLADTTYSSRIRSVKLFRQGAF